MVHLPRHHHKVLCTTVHISGTHLPLVCCFINNIVIYHYISKLSIHILRVHECSSWLLLEVPLPQNQAGEDHETSTALHFVPCSTELCANFCEEVNVMFQILTVRYTNITFPAARSGPTGLGIRIQPKSQMLSLPHSLDQSAQGLPSPCLPPSRSTFPLPSSTTTPNLLCQPSMASVSLPTLGSGVLGLTLLSQHMSMCWMRTLQEWHKCALQHGCNTSRPA